MKSTWKMELEAIRKRPGFYLGDIDIPFTRLLAFSAGHEVGYNAAQRGFMSHKEFVPLDFAKFVTEYFGRTFPDGGKGWQTFIAENTSTEQEAFELFFRLREEYEKSRANGFRSYVLDAGELVDALKPISPIKLGEVRHVLVQPSIEFVKLCLHMFGEEGGIFGMPMRYDSNALPYLEPEDSRIMDEFTWWKLHLNQMLVPALAACGKSTGFTMLISADTKPSVLRSIYDSVSLDKGYFDWEDCLPIVIAMLKELQWCYVPLPGGYSPGCLLVSDDLSARMQAICAALKQEGHDFWFFARDGTLTDQES